jgi:hypothetical protein
MKSLMTRQFGLAVGVVAAALTLVSLANAHHSVALQFDMSSELEIEGTVVAMEWRNPHAWLQVEVESESGEIETWQVEFGSANSLYRRGWRRDDLPIGTHVEILGLAARDGSNTIAAEDVTLPDGRRLFAGSRPRD